MSHFSVLVLVPKDVTDIEQEVERLLTPYDENTEVEKYEKPCHCVGQQARNKAGEIVRAAFGLQPEQRFYDLAVRLEPVLGGPWKGFSSDPVDYERQRVWEAFVDGVEAAEKHVFGALPEAEQKAPNAGCGECDGTGVYHTTYNPKSRWDWWVIGGRWAGYLGERDVAPVAKVLEQWPETATRAVVTPDGEWHQRGEMGWWGMSRGNVPKHEWLQAARGLLEQNPDCIAVVVDCHI